MTKTHPLDFLFVLRPTLFYPVWTFFLAGYWGATQNYIEIGGLKKTLNFWLVLSGMTMLMGSVFILNQTQDVETDRMNSKLFLLANGIISIKTAYIEAFILALIGLVMGFFVSPIIGFGILLLLILSGWLYNYPPFIWKNRPILGMMVNVLGGWIIYYLGWFVLSSQVIFPVQSVGYVFACAAVFLNTTLPDVEGDAENGKMTLGVKWGVKKTVLWAAAFELLALFAALFTKDKLLLMTSILVSPFFIVSALRPSVPNAIRATKFSIFIMTMVVCYYFLYFLIPVWVIFFGSVAYYRLRFNIHYPNFKCTVDPE